MKKEIASTDKTYCHAIFCDKCYKCSRYAENYKFDDDKYYSFIFNCFGTRVDEYRLFEKKEVKNNGKR